MSPPPACATRTTCSNGRPCLVRQRLRGRILQQAALAQRLPAPALLLCQLDVACQRQLNAAPRRAAGIRAIYHALGPAGACAAVRCLQWMCSSFWHSCNSWQLHLQASALPPTDHHRPLPPCHLTSGSFCNAAPLNIDEMLAMHGMQGSGHALSPYNLPNEHIAGLPTSNCLSCEDVPLDPKHTFVVHIITTPLGQTRALDLMCFDGNRRHARSLLSL